VMNYKSGDLKSQIAAEIHDAMKMMISEENLAKSAKEELADRLNALSEEARVLALELGREATPEELAVRAGISQEEVSELMKITLNAMSREGQLK
jgi:sigma-70 region 3